MKQKQENKQQKKQVKNNPWGNHLLSLNLNFFMCK